MVPSARALVLAASLFHLSAEAFAKCPVSQAPQAESVDGDDRLEYETKIAGLYFSDSSDWVADCANEAIESGNITAAIVAIEYFKTNPRQVDEKFNVLAISILSGEKIKDAGITRAVLEVSAFLSGIEGISLSDDLAFVIEDESSWFRGYSELQDALDWYAYRNQNRGTVALYGNDNIAFLSADNPDRPKLEKAMEVAARIELLTNDSYSQEELSKLSFLKKAVLADFESSLSSEDVSSTKALSHFLLFWQLDAIVSAIYPQALSKGVEFMSPDDWFAVNERLQRHWQFRSKLSELELNEMLALNDDLMWGARKPDWERLANYATLVVESGDIFTYVVDQFNIWHESNLNEPNGIFRSLLASSWLDNQDLSNIEIPRVARTTKPFNYSFVDIYKILAKTDPFDCFGANEDDSILTKTKKAFTKSCAGTSILVGSMLRPIVTALSKQDPISMDIFPNGHTLFFILAGAESMKIFAEAGDEGEKAFRMLFPSPVPVIEGRERHFLSDVICRSFGYDAAAIDYLYDFFKGEPEPTGEEEFAIDWSALVINMQVQSSLLLGQYFNNPTDSLESYASQYFFLYHGNRPKIKCNAQHLEGYFYYADQIGIVQPEDGDEVFDFDDFRMMVGFTMGKLDILTSHVYFNKI